VLLPFILVDTATAQNGGGYRFALLDQPGEGDDIKRGLWQFSKTTPYEEAKQHIANAKKKNQVIPSAKVESIREHKCKYPWFRVLPVDLTKPTFSYPHAE
jgi:hypothetical protein